LNDGAEQTHGTDPYRADSDGDGYSDADEVHAKTDPLDAESVIYQGGWPYNRHKDAIVAPSWDAEFAVGTVAPPYRAVDQFGDLVDLYDFGGHEKPVVIELSTAWCQPCHALSAWLHSGDISHMDKNKDGTVDQDDYKWWRDEYAAMPTVLEENKVYWVTVMVQNLAHEAPDTSTVEDWWTAYPDARVTILGDDAQQLYQFIKPTGYPAVNIINPDMTMATASRRGGDEAFAYLASLAAAE
jgi:hypothetical protein